MENEQNIEPAGGPESGRAREKTRGIKLSPLSVTLSTFVGTIAIAGIVGPYVRLSQFALCWADPGLFFASVLYLDFRFPSKSIWSGRNLWRVCMYGLRLGSVFPALHLIVYLGNALPLVPRGLDPAWGEFLKASYLFRYIVVAPILEEALFRGYYYRILRIRYRPFWAGLVSIIFFAFMAPPGLNNILTHCLIGVIVTYAYEKTGSIWASVIVHFMNNLSFYLLNLLGR